MALKDIRQPSVFDPLFDSDSGQLERPAPHDRIWVPGFVELVDDALVFAQYRIGAAEAKKIRARGEGATYDDLLIRGWRPGAGGVRFVAPADGMLLRFAELGDASEVEIRNYARKWGPLLLCKHRLPVGHHTDCHPLGWAFHSWWEPLEGWRRHARVARAMLKLAVALDSRSRCSEADWDVLLNCPWARLFREHRQKLLQGHRQGGSFLLTLGVQEWLRMGQVSPRIYSSPGNERFYLRVGGKGLFGALAYSLALAVAQVRGFAVCSACEQFYAPTRRPSPSKRAYCPTCRDAGKSVRDAERDCRQRKRDAIELLSKGRSVPKVARATGARLATVTRLAKLAHRRKRSGRQMSSGRGARRPS